MNKLLKILLILSINIFLVSCSAKEINNNLLKNPDSQIKDDLNTKIEDGSTEKSNIEKNNSPSTETNNKSENSIITSKANIYYYDIISDKIVYTKNNINIENKAVAKALIKELKTSPNSSIRESINENIDIISAKVVKEKDLIILDFTENFVSAQNLGSGPEGQTLTAIVNTFGDFFSVNNVKITLKGKPYSSGHIALEENDSFKVNLNNTIELLNK